MSSNRHVTGRTPSQYPSLLNTTDHTIKKERHIGARLPQRSSILKMPTKQSTKKKMILRCEKIKEGINRMLTTRWWYLILSSTTNSSGTTMWFTTMETSKKRPQHLGHVSNKVNAYFTVNVSDIIVVYIAAQIRSPIGVFMATFLTLGFWVFTQQFNRRFSHFH